MERENGGILTEATLSKELQEENDEEVLEALSRIRDLGVVSVIAGFDTSAQAAQLCQRPPEDNSKAVLRPPSKAISQPDAQAYPVPKNRQEPPEHINPPSSLIEPLNRDFSMGDEGPELVTILAKPPPIQPEHFAPGRPIAQAEVPDGDLEFHNQEIPHAHMLLIFRELDKRELIRPIPGGQLDYTDPQKKKFNVATLINGQLFQWPKDLLSHDNLKRLNPLRELQRLPKGIEDTNQVHGRRETTSLEQVAREASSSDEMIIFCDCKGKCATKICHCFKRNKKCSVYCHKSREHNCGFLAYSTELDMTVNPAKSKERKRQRSSSTEETITVDDRRNLLPTTVSRQ